MWAILKKWQMLTYLYDVFYDLKLHTKELLLFVNYCQPIYTCNLYKLFELLYNMVLGIYKKNHPKWSGIFWCFNLKPIEKL